MALTQTGGMLQVIRIAAVQDMLAKKLLDREAYDALPQPAS